MTYDEATRQKKEYLPKVIGQELSKAIKGFLIKKILVDELYPGNYECFVVGQNLKSKNKFYRKRLDEWLNDNPHCKIF